MLRLSLMVKSYLVQLNVFVKSHDAEALPWLVVEVSEHSKDVRVS